MTSSATSNTVRRIGKCSAKYVQNVFAEFGGHDPSSGYEMATDELKTELTKLKCCQC